MIRACLEGTFQPLMGMALFTEYEDLMARDTLFITCLLDADERDKLFNAFLSVCEWKNIYYLWRPNLRDEADNHVVELAISGHAEYIVTYNIRDFKNAQLHFPNLQIVKPEYLLIY